MVGDIHWSAQKLLSRHLFYLAGTVGVVAEHLVELLDALCTVHYLTLIGLGVEDLFHLLVGVGLLGVGYWLLGVVYWLLGVGYWLLGVGYWLLFSEDADIVQVASIVVGFLGYDAESGGFLGEGFDGF